MRHGVYARVDGTLMCAMVYACVCCWHSHVRHGVCAGVAGTPMCAVVYARIYIKQLPHMYMYINGPFSVQTYRPTCSKLFMRQ